MKIIGRRRRVLLWGILCLVLSAPASSRAATPAICTEVVLSGEVTANHEWKRPFGQGWVFRVLSIQPGGAGYSGWDLVVDREQPAGFPDALLLATPPYNSISEREVGTTFGLRAQDALGWNPRSFRFLTDPAAFREGQKLFQTLSGTNHAMPAPNARSREGMAIERLLKLNQESSAGQFRIVDARLAPGTADAAPYAEKWAIQFARTPHSLAPSAGAKGMPLGELDWIRFSITLRLSRSWNVPKDMRVLRAPCFE